MPDTDKMEILRQAIQRKMPSNVDENQAIRSPQDAAAEMGQTFQQRGTEAGQPAGASGASGAVDSQSLARQVNAMKTPSGLMQTNPATPTPQRNDQNSDLAPASDGHNAQWGAFLKSKGVKPAEQ